MLTAIGDEMAACRDLPMGDHDLEALSQPPVTEALTRMIAAETELVTVLDQQLVQHSAMLDGESS